MARETRGPMPPQTNGLERVSLNRSHWLQARRLVVAQAAATGLLGAVGLIGVLAGAHPEGWVVLGVPLTPALSAVLLGIAAAAAVAARHRCVAKVFTLSMSAAMAVTMIICSVAAVHQEPGPLGFTAPAILLWTVLFCWSIAAAIWVLPDQIQGPAWLPRRCPRRRTDSAMSTGWRPGS